MKAVTRNSLRDLDFRMGVSSKVLGLLSLAHGLDLLKPDEYVAEVVERRDPWLPLGLGESNQGLDLLGEDPVRVVLVTQEVFYPAPGWWCRLPFWEADRVCADFSMGSCAFPMACICYG